MARKRNRKIAHVQNEYTEMKKERMKQQRRRRKKVYRRLMIGALVMTLVVSIFGWEYYQKSKRFNELAIEKETLKEQLEEVDTYQKDLKDELKKLEDDEYIEKLARQKYLVGKSGETIFSIPEEDVEDDQKDDEEEDEKK